MGKNNYMVKSEKELVYKCISKDKIKEIANIYKDNKVSEHIEDLYALIRHQLQEIHVYRSNVIANKHSSAWHQYNDII